MWSTQDALRAEISGVSEAERKRADASMRFVQSAFRKLDERLANLPRDQRQAVEAVVAGRLIELLYVVHAEVELLASATVKPTGSGMAVVQHLAARVHAQRELYDFYHPSSEQG